MSLGARWPADASMSTIARPENLAAVLAFVDGVFDRAGIAGSTRHDIRLAVEEICTNVIRHGYVGREPGPLSLLIRDLPSQYQIVVEDEATPFHPAWAPEPDLSSGWEDRERGGLGWHLVRNVVDDIRYECPGGTGNKVTLVKLKPASGGTA